MTASEYLIARQRGYQILCSSLGAPAYRERTWQQSVAAAQMHTRAVQLLNRIEAKMGITEDERDMVWSRLMSENENYLRMEPA